MPLRSQNSLWVLLRLLPSWISLVRLSPTCLDTTGELIMLEVTNFWPARPLPSLAITDDLPPPMDWSW